LECLDGLSNVYFDFIELLRITKDNILNDMLNKLIILVELIKDDTQLLFAKSALTDFGIDCLFDGEFLNVRVVTILSDALK